MGKELSIEEIVSYVLEKNLIDKNITIQVYEELVHLGHFLNSLKPHNILEVGARGGTFLLFSKLSTGTKIAVDLDSEFKDNIYLSMLGEDFYFLNENSQSIETFEKIKGICPQFDFIFIDGDHSYEGVKRDFELYKELLSPRGYIAFHDIDPDHAFRNIYSSDESKTGKVRRFWEELDFGTKVEIICQKSNGKGYVPYDSSIKEHFGGIGIWRP
jgi:predicted O-methyltransferase YrrM